MMLSRTQCSARLLQSFSRLTLASTSSSSSSASLSSISPFSSAILPTSRNFSTENNTSNNKSNTTLDLDDLFGEELELSGENVTKSDMGSNPQLIAEIRAEAIARESEDYSDVLSPFNPPRLREKDYSLLKEAMKETQLKAAAVQIADEEVSRKLSKLSHRMRRVLSAHHSKPDEFNNEKTVHEFLDLSESMPGALKVNLPGKVDPLKLLKIDHKTTRANRHLYCRFCRPDTAQLPRNELVYTNVNLLLLYVNARGMIAPREQTMLCMKHQRKLAKCIKQSRTIGLLSTQSNWRVPLEYVYGSEATKAIKPTAAAEQEALENSLRITEEWNSKSNVAELLEEDDKVFRRK